ncbi:periodic tryptophan protein 2 homolog [Culicoides brevitarsis]|uniref:periodic tryptophan protein 2 homolog n=1 Tax=Culicoides brevitarsis TaxID=469753 RepID=UPI00307B1F8A
MKFAYKFNNLLGTVYRKGNLLFTPDGNCVISPVGNRITIFDMKNNKSQTLSFESMYNYTAMDLSPNGCLLVAVNEKGQAHMISMISQTVIHKYKFSCAVSCIKFSPNGKYFAACKENFVMIFKTPGTATGEYTSFLVHRVLRTNFDQTTTLEWSDDSKLLAVGGKDSVVRVFAVEYVNNFRPYAIGQQSSEIVGCFFSENSLDLNTVGRNGQLVQWKCNVSMSELTPKVDEEESEAGKFVKRIKQEESETEDELGENPIEKEIDADEAFEEAEDFEEDEEDKKRDELGKKIIVKEENKPRHPFFYTKTSRHYLADEPRKENPKAKLTSAAYHKQTKLLIVAFTTGAFYLYELPAVTMIHSLSISEYQIDTCCFNDTGDWIALGVAGLGQLLVWEWQSEQYVMKQQGHSNEMTSVAYSPDGQFLATGGTDAKIKLWNMLNGFCFVTFTEHTSAVTGIQFSNSKKFLVSASLDGTVRAFDIIRYRNFKTFTTPRMVQFGCVALDHSGELVAAGGQDVFEIYLWSVKFGHLLEILSGHEGPVVSLAFSPVATSTAMVSASWDQTIKIWDCLETTTIHETIDLMSDALHVAMKPDGEEVAVATLNGNISVFNVKTAQQVATIEGRKDMGSGVSDVDLVTAKKNLEGKAFNSITYSADGECILAGGKSKNVCIYHVYESMLLKKFEITQNHSLDGMWDFIHRRNMTEFGNMALLEERENLEGGNVAIKLPGVAKGDLAARKFKPEISVYSVKFSPSGQSWSAATTEGLLIYSLDKGVVFDPYYLSLEVTPKSIRECLRNEEYSTSLIMALKLNEQKLIQEIVEKIPHKQIPLVVPSLPDDFAHRLLAFIVKALQVSPHLEFYLLWANTILTCHGQKEGVMAPQTLVALHQAYNHRYETIHKICDFNKYTMQVLKRMAALKMKSDGFKDPLTEREDEDGDDLMLLRNRNQDTSEDESSTSEE